MNSTISIQSRRLLIAVASLALAACSLTTIAYNNVVPLASWYVDDYVDLSEPQQERLRESLSRLHGWHRSSELPEYSRVLETLSRRLDKPVAREDILGLYDDGRRLMRRLGEKALPDMTDLLLTLTPDQIRALEDKLRRDNEKFETERIRQPLARREKERVERFLKGLESWLGTVTTEQQGLVRAALPGMPLNDELRLADRRRLQAEFIALLRNPPARPQLGERLRVILFNPENGRSPAYQAATLQWRQDNADLLCRIFEKATPEQRTHLQRKLRGYSSDVVALMTAS